MASLDDLKKRIGRVPGLAVVQVGNVAASSVSHTIGNTVVYGIGLNMDDGEVTYYANGSSITNLTAVDLDGLVARELRLKHERMSLT